MNYCAYLYTWNGKKYKHHLKNNDNNFYDTLNDCSLNVYCGHFCYQNHIRQQGNDSLLELKEINKYPDNTICNNCMRMLSAPSYHGTSDKLCDSDPCFIPLICDQKLWFCSFRCREPYIQPTLVLQDQYKFLKWIYSKNKSWQKPKFIPYDPIEALHEIFN